MKYVLEFWLKRCFNCTFNMLVCFFIEFKRLNFEDILLLETLDISLTYPHRINRYIIGGIASVNGLQNDV